MTGWLIERQNKGVKFMQFVDDTKFVLPGYEHPSLEAKSMRLELMVGLTSRAPASSRSHMQMLVSQPRHTMHH